MIEGDEIVVNGRRRSADPGLMLPDVLYELGIDTQAAQGVAVAVNDMVIRKQDWAVRALEPGDRVEVVTAKQGG